MNLKLKINKFQILKMIWIEYNQIQNKQNKLLLKNQIHKNSWINH